MSWQRGAIAVGEQREAVVEGGEYGTDASFRDAAGHELERQRDAVEPPGDLRDVRQLGRCGPELSAGVGRPLHDEAHRGRGHGSGEAFLAIGRRHLQRSDRHHALVRYADRFDAGSEDHEVRAGARQLVDGCGDAVEAALAAVEHHETAAGPHRGDQRVEGLDAGLGPRARGGRQRGRHETGAVDRRQFGEVQTVGEQGGRRSGRLEREARLADASRPDQRDERVRLQQFGQLVELAVAADQARPRDAQAVVVPRRARRCDGVEESGPRELSELDGPLEVAQAEAAEALHVGVGRQRGSASTASVTRTCPPLATADTRAAWCTASATKSPSARRSAGPQCIPIRTRTGAGHGSLPSARCASAAKARASPGSSKARKKPSPSVLTSCPPVAASVSRINAR